MEVKKTRTFIIGLLVGVFGVPLLLLLGLLLAGKLSENKSTEDSIATPTAEEVQEIPQFKASIKANFNISASGKANLGDGPYHVYLVYGSGEAPWILPTEPGNDAGFTGDVVYVGQFDSFPATLEAPLPSGGLDLLALKSDLLGLKQNATLSFIVGTSSIFMEHHRTLGTQGVLKPGEQIKASTVLYNGRAEVLHAPIFSFLRDKVGTIDVGTVVFNEIYKLKGSSSFSATECLSSSAKVNYNVSFPKPEQLAKFKKFRLVRVLDEYAAFINGEAIYRASKNKAPGSMGGFYDDLGEVSASGPNATLTKSMRRMTGENRFYKLAAVNCSDSQSTNTCLDAFAQDYYVKKLNVVEGKSLILNTKENLMPSCDTASIDVIFWYDGKSGDGLNQSYLAEKDKTAPLEIVR